MYCKYTHDNGTTWFQLLLAALRRSCQSCQRPIQKGFQEAATICEESMSTGLQWQAIHKNMNKMSLILNNMYQDFASGDLVNVAMSSNLSFLDLVLAGHQHLGICPVRNAPCACPVMLLQWHCQCQVHRLLVLASRHPKHKKTTQYLYPSHICQQLKFWCRHWLRWWITLSRSNNMSDSAAVPGWVLSVTAAAETVIHKLLVLHRLSEHPTMLGTRGSSLRSGQPRVAQDWDWHSSVGISLLAHSQLLGSRHVFRERANRYVCHWEPNPGLLQRPWHRHSID